MTGECRYCHQTMMTDADSIERADEIATMSCKCEEGRIYRNIQDMKCEAKQNAYALFSSDQMTEREEMLLGTMSDIIDIVAAGIIEKATLKINERTSASIFITAKDGIRIKKNYKEEFVLEANRY